jgi:LmbE family N-acetylglucosaminyl deacetylase
MFDVTEPGKRRLMIFSHPNHELGLYGFEQRVRPSFVFLTDGSTEKRIGESKAALDAIGLLEKARYLLYPESSIYERMLDGDVAYFEEIVERVRAVVDEIEPEQVFCDAVEFYNPTHDISLPITRAALAGRPDVEVFEVPLAYQPSNGADTIMQRVMPSRREEAISIRLTPEATAAKRRARDEIYSVLRADLGETICGIAEEQLAIEEMRPADRGLQPVPGECRLRYDERGRLFLERGEVDRALTWAEHYRPVAERLFSLAA